MTSNTCTSQVLGGGGGGGGGGTVLRKYTGGGGTPKKGVSGAGTAQKRSYLCHIIFHMTMNLSWRDTWHVGTLSVGLIQVSSEFWFFYWMFYDPFSARSLLAKLGRWGWWWGWGWLERMARRSEEPGVWTKDLINFIPMYFHHWDCRLGPVQVCQAWEYLWGGEMS